MLHELYMSWNINCLFIYKFKIHTLLLKKVLKLRKNTWGKQIKNLF